MTLSFIAPLADEPTEMTIQAPKRAVEEEPFRVRGRLRSATTKRPIGDQPIDLYYDSFYIDSTLTDRRGRFTFNIAIYEAGIFDLTGRYEGL